MKILQCSIMFRAYLLFMSAMYGVTGLTQPETLVYQTAHAAHSALLAMCLMVLFALLGLIDLVVNDLMPDRFVLKRALRDRHLVSMAIAMCFCVQMWVEVRQKLPLALVPFYLAYVIFVPLSAFADVRKRFKKGSR